MAKHILVIDDDQSVRDCIASRLVLEGYDVRKAKNGNVVNLELTAQQPPDLIITDLFMPDSEGIETIRKIREFSTDIPIIAMSGAIPIDGIDYLEMAHMLGATQILRKPFNSADLLKLVASCLETPADDAGAVPPEPAIGVHFHARGPHAGWQFEWKASSEQVLANSLRATSDDDAEKRPQNSDHPAAIDNLAKWLNKKGLSLLESADRLHRAGVAEIGGAAASPLRSAPLSL